MIERKFVSEKMREYLVNEYLYKELGPGKYSSFEIKRTPLGERIIIYTARPGLIVGKGGENIRDLTKVFKTKFKMENPQIEVAEISNPNIDAQTMAEQIVTTLERFGPKRFKSVGYKTLQRIIDAGAMGAEIAIGGRGLPGARAKTWKFYAGYLKKSGDVSMSKVAYGLATANLKSGSIGIKVRILPPHTILPDKLTLIDQAKMTIHVEEVKTSETEEENIEKEEEKVKTKKKTVKKKTIKKTKDEQAKNEDQE
ncbi:MAG: ribosomal protein S3P Rps3p, small subunit ribosomal protein S3 [archaeon GW2011_AR17]|nr:ribosomal protein S3P Rps3p, small subunit ribosomal protein S3 [uncultured archaeon]KHO52365.1 MAG: ribosomal protein S3P Rps3p, small subunit ribosomal protein S3 [archaeon GW2011_AR17]MBS3154309.1 30S ribosomal protein S3 [Candidatus Woesearchaeota archaeon]HIH15249.1 30S ribosomal protein S3 [Nanoarchaeota archaeon]HIH58598.1 30S ribosomal protein S3 [Nanoarchaeota archaeon]